MDEASACSICFAVLERGSVCARCVDSFSSEEHSADLPAIDGFALISPIGDGGTAEVYLAREPNSETLVALKLAKNDSVSHAFSADVFKWELRAAQALNHPNIVRVLSFGVADNRPFLVMDLLEGGSLEEQKPWRSHNHAFQALQLMLKICAAVAHAHARGIIHCDIKPANILFDTAGQPSVSDFGLARAWRFDVQHDMVDVRGGSHGWMAPEQVKGEDPTTATDVFSLGLLLHWLLTGEHAFGCDDRFDARVLHDPTPALGRLLPWELDVIRTRALAKDPEQRYRDAGELLQELENVRDGQPISDEKRRPIRRLSKWVRRHLVTAFFGIELLALLAYVAFVPVTQPNTIAEIVRRQNTTAAQAQAGAVTNELRMRSEDVAQLSRNPKLPELLAGCETEFPDQLIEHFSRVFDSVWTFTLDGRPCGAWPSQHAREPNYLWRDYLRGQSELAKGDSRGVYVAKVIRDDVDRELKLAYSTTIYDATGRKIGAIVATTRTRETFGSVQMRFSAAGDCVTALVGPRDRDTHFTRPSELLTVVAEPGLQAGAEVVLRKAESDTICQRLGCTPRVHDPFGFDDLNGPIVIEDLLEPVHGLPTIAGIAPVGHTGMAVIVATPHESVTTLNASLRDRFSHHLLSCLWLPLLLGALAVASIATATRRFPR